MDEQTTKAIAVEMGNVTRAAFAFLAPAAPENAPEPVSQAPAQDAVPTPAIPVQSAPPASLPVPSFPVPALSDVRPERQATAPAVAPIAVPVPVPVPAPAPAPAPATGPTRSFALLNEIAFLDD